MSNRRTACWLMILLGLFVIAMIGVMLVTQRREARSGLLITTEIKDLQERLGKAPKDEALKLEIRRKDQRIRQEYSLNRRRFKSGSYLLIIALALWIAAARWFFTLAPAKSPEEILSRPPEPYRPVQGVMAVGLVAVLLFVGLALEAMESPKSEILKIQSEVLKIQSGVRSPESGVLNTKAPAKAGTPKLEAPAKAVTPKLEAPAKAVTSKLEAPAKAVIPKLEAVTPKLETVGVASAFKGNWPGFRGPDNIGVADPGKYPTAWNAAQKLNIAWQTAITLTGKSSPIVWGGCLFISGADEKQQHVACFDRSSGKLLWNAKVTPPMAPAEIQAFEATGFAAPTPVTDGSRVYAMFANGLLAAFDFTGRQLWAKNLGAPESSYGFASSLLLCQNTLILQFDQGSDVTAGKSKLLGFDPATGNIRWSVPRPVPNSWASPALIHTPARLELVTCAAPWIIAYDPLKGTELWKVKGLDGDVAASPAYGGGLLFISNDRAKLLAIRPGGSGDVTASHVAWSSDKGMPDIASPVADGKRIFQVAPGGSALTCFSADKGALLWEQNNSSSVSASPILAGGLVYLTGEDGATQIIELADKFQLRSKGDVGEPVYATPAFADSRIYIRGDKHLFCVGAPMP